MPVSSGILATALVLLAGAVSIWPGAGVIARARLRCLSVPEGSGSEPPAEGAFNHRRALLFTGLAASAVLVTFPSVGGALAAVVASSAVHLILHGSIAGDRSRARLGGLFPAMPSLRGRLGRRPESDPMLPFAIDLLAVCLRSGMSTPAALRSVAGVVSGACAAQHATSRAGAIPQVSLVLGRVAAAGELGSEAATAWREWVGHPVYGPLARALVVTGESGSAVADRLDSVSKHLRNAAGHQAIARAQRVGVALMAPLGLCFLPAFVCLGVVPVVVGIAGRVFG